MNPSAPAWSPGSSVYPQLPAQQTVAPQPPVDQNWNPYWRGRGRGFGYRGRGYYPRYRGRGRGYARSQSRDRGRSTDRSSTGSIGRRRRGHNDQWYSGKQKNPVTWGWVSTGQDGPGRHNPRNPWNYADSEVLGSKGRDWRLPTSGRVSRIDVEDAGDGCLGYCVSICFKICPPRGKGVSFGSSSVEDAMKKLKLSDGGKESKKKGGLFGKWRSTSDLTQS